MGDRLTDDENRRLERCIEGAFHADHAARRLFARLLSEVTDLRRKLAAAEGQAACWKREWTVYSRGNHDLGRRLAAAETRAEMAEAVVEAVRLDLADAKHQCGGDGSRCKGWVGRPRRCSECPMDAGAFVALAIYDAARSENPAAGAIQGGGAVSGEADPANGDTQTIARPWQGLGGK